MPFKNLRAEPNRRSFLFCAAGSASSRSNPGGMLAVFNVTPSATDGATGSLRAALVSASTNSDTSNTINLAVGTYALTDSAVGNLLIDNAVGERRRLLLSPAPAKRRRSLAAETIGLIASFKSSVRPVRLSRSRCETLPSPEATPTRLAPWGVPRPSAAEC